MNNCFRCYLGSFPFTFGTERTTAITVSSSFTLLSELMRRNQEVGIKALGWALGEQQTLEDAQQRVSLSPSLGRSLCLFHVSLTVQDLLTIFLLAENCICGHEADSFPTKRSLCPSIPLPELLLEHVG